MSYEPPLYTPPPQERWPQATPPVPWPSYQDADVAADRAVYRAEEQFDGRYAADHQGAYAGYAEPAYAQPAYAQPGYAQPGYAQPGYAQGTYAQGTYAQPQYGQDVYAQPGYAHGYGQGGHASGDGYGYLSDGFDGAQPDFTGPVGYSDWDSYSEPVPSKPAGPLLTAPDAGLRQDHWQAEQDRRAAVAQRGLTVGAWTGLLAVEVAIGVSTLAAAFVRPQAAPIIAGGGVFVDRIPAGLRNAAMTHFGSHGRTVLLIGMYLAIAVLALGLGMLSRRAAALGVASLAAFTLLGAFIAITRPGGQPTDVVPAVIGGVAGIAALLWLQRASAPVAPDHGGGRPVPAARRGGRRSR
jgi:hypothetical protein